MDRLLLRLEQRHAAAAARDQHRLHPGAAQQQPSRPLQRLRVIVDMNAQRGLDFRLVRRAGGQAAVVQQPVARVEQHRNRTAPRPPRHDRANRVGERRRDQARAVIRQQHGVARVERRPDLLRERRADRFVERPPRLAIDADHLLPRRMNATGQNARLDRRPVLAGADDVGLVHAAMEAGQQPASFGVGADQTGEARPAAERGDVVGGVAGAAGNHLRRVVLEDQDRRLARDARHRAVDELVGDRDRQSRESGGWKTRRRAPSKRSLRSASPGRG